MRKIKRIVSVILAMVMIVAAVSAVSVSAGAAGVFSSAKTMEALEYYNKNFQNKNDEQYYKIKVTKPGTLIFRASDVYYINFTLFDSNAEKISSSDGYLNEDSWLDKDIKINKAGTYYLRLKATTNYNNGSYIKDLYYTFKPTEEPTIKLAISLGKGSTLQLGYITENYDGTVKWQSTKTSVATVTKKGKVTAVKKGQATIRASLDNGTYVEVKIVVQ